MTAVFDSTFVLALYERDAARRADVAAWYRAADEDFVTTPLVVARIDELVRRRGGTAGARAFARDLDSGAWQVRWWADAMGETLAIARRNPELTLVDASLLALADRLRTDRLATLDERFAAVTTSDGQSFTILPTSGPAAKDQR